MAKAVDAERERAWTARAGCVAPLDPSSAGPSARSRLVAAGSVKEMDSLRPD